MGTESKGMAIGSTLPMLVAEVLKNNFTEIYFTCYKFYQLLFFLSTPDDMLIDSQRREGRERERETLM